MTQNLNFAFINIDKPSGPTSFQVSNFIRRELNLKKTSHLGTLDPKVTGVLPIALGRACRLSEIFMHKDKTYVGIMRLHNDISLNELKKQIKDFIGTITQIPPIRSRVKRAPRQRTVHTFKILEKQGQDVLFETKVQAGTYIRKLISDLGEKIGGAHMLELRRTQAGLFSEEQSINLYEFEKALPNNELNKIIIPAEELIKQTLETVQINPLSLKKVLTGKPLTKEDVKLQPKNETFALFNKEQFIGIYHKVLEEKNPSFVARPNFIYN